MSAILPDESLVCKPGNIFKSLAHSTAEPAGSMALQTCRMRLIFVPAQVLGAACRAGWSQGLGCQGPCAERCSQLCTGPYSL